MDGILDGLQEQAKMAAEKAYQDRNYSPAQDAIQGTASVRPSTLKDEAAKSAQYHSTEANKAAAAHVFLAAHPEFDEFIRLIRSGSIHI